MENRSLSSQCDGGGRGSPPSYTAEPDNFCFLCLRANDTKRGDPYYFPFTFLDIRLKVSLCADWFLEEAEHFIHESLLSLFQVPSFTRLCELLDAHSVPILWRESIREITCCITYLDKEGFGGDTVESYVVVRNCVLSDEMIHVGAQFRAPVGGVVG